MNKVCILRVFFWIFIVLGFLSLIAGIFLPIFFRDLVNENLRDLWMKPGDADKWSSTPGDDDIKVIRSFKIFNYTNVAGISNGEKPVLVELPPLSFREYTGYYNWEYCDENGTGYGQDDAKDYLSYNYYTNLSSIPNNQTLIADNAPVTSVNYVMYFNLYGLTHSSPVFYMLPVLYEVVNALESDFYVMILSYCAWKANISNETATESYLLSLGFNENDVTAIYNDSTYGWKNWKTLKPWIQCVLDYSKNQTYNAYETINMHFQVENLEYLINSSSLLSTLIENIQQDMLTRYGTNDPVQLGLIQWSSGNVTKNLPLNLLTLNITGSNIPLPSFLMMNTTFSVFPEYYFMQFPLGLNFTDFYPIAASLLQVSYTYPRTNTQSLLNLNNLATAANPPLAIKTFNFTNETEFLNIFTYLSALINTPIPGYNVTNDKYSLFLSKLSTKSIVMHTVLLRNDAYWTVPTAMVINQFRTQGVNCGVWMSNVNATLAALCDNNAIGWNSDSNLAWYNFQIWVKAAYKGPTSLEYATLLNFTSQQELQQLLYQNQPNLFNYTVDALKNTSILYNCTKIICNYEELFVLQWATSNVTLTVPPELSFFLKPSSTIKSWFPLTYLVPIEWSYYSNLPIYSLAGSVLTYDQLLNPGIIRMYYNSYLNGNQTATSSKFGIPIPYLKPLYQYFLSIIPGFNLFTTRPYKSWITGYIDPFLLFVNKTSIYEGGMPTTSPFGGIAVNTSDGRGPNPKPKSMVSTGRMDTKLTKMYYKLFDSRIYNSYTTTYNEYLQNFTSYYYKPVWAKNFTIFASDGGRYGTQINDNDVVSVYISTTYRDLNLTYDGVSTYHGLDVSHFILQPGALNTSVTVAKNADYYQLPNGYDGFVNVSAAYGAPAFISLMHCYLCEPLAVEMYENHEYLSNGTMGGIITSSKADMPYADIEPLTGSGVNVFLNFEFKVGIYNDYFFQNFYEPIKGKGTYLPAFTMTRKAAMSQSQINKFFGNLQFIQEFRRVMFYIGIIVGSAFVIISLVIGMLMYRMNKFRTSWRAPKHKMIKKLITKKEKDLEFRKEDKEMDS